MTRASLAALAAVILLGTAVRFSQLGRESLWTDEVLSVELARRPWPALIPATREDGHPPLYAASLRVWIQAFGEGEASVRSLSALLGVLTLPAFFALGARLLPVRGALLATLLLACSPYHVYYSQEARNYALLVLLTVASYAALLTWDERPRPGRAAVYVIATVLLLYTHVFAFFVWAAQMLWVAGRMRGREDRLARTVPFLVIGVLLLPWIAGPWAATLLRQTSAGTTHLRLVRPTLGALFTSALQFAGSPVAAVVLAPAAGLEVYRALIGHVGGDGTETSTGALTPRSRTALLVLWTTVPQLVPFLISQVAVPIYITRATIVSLPPLYLLAAALLCRLGWRARAALTGIVVVASLGAQFLYFQVPAKEQWREVASTVDARARPGDLAVFDAPYGRRGFDYYSRTPALRKVGLANDVTTAAGAAEIAALPSEARRLWVIRFQRPRGRERVPQALSAKYRLAGSAAYQGIELYLFERAGPTTTW